VCRGVNYEKIYTRSYAHADYYPGAMKMTIKMLFDPKNGRIFGVQIAGEDGVDKRIDVFATAMRAGLTIDKLSELELAYSPLFGVVKDPVNMAGYVALNVMHGISSIIHWHDVETLKDVLWLDVRTPQEYSQGTIKGAVNMPVDMLRYQIETLPKDRMIAVFCESGYRSYAAERILSQNGFSVKNLCGGYSLYKLFKNTKAVKDGHCQV
jgi:rhodanese-related sulfurtransferase